MTFLSFTITASQEPDQWEVDEEDDAGAEQVNEVGFFYLTTRVLIFLQSDPGGPGKGCCYSCHFSWTGGKKKRSTLTSKKSSQDSPLLGERVDVEVELHSVASFHQVDISHPNCSFYI